MQPQYQQILGLLRLAIFQIFCLEILIRMQRYKDFLNDSKLLNHFFDFEKNDYKKKY